MKKLEGNSESNEWRYLDVNVRYVFRVTAVAPSKRDTCKREKLIFLPVQWLSDDICFHVLFEANYIDLTHPSLCSATFLKAF
jgi:hypothetical protein